MTQTPDDVPSPTPAQPGTTDPASPETEPAETTAPSVNQEVPAFGWVSYAERLNGRFAMVGFVALLLLEWLSGQDFFTWLGLR
jgi:hypothetical protein